MESLKTSWARYLLGLFDFDLSGIDTELILRSFDLDLSDTDT